MCQQHQSACYYLACILLHSRQPWQWSGTSAVSGRRTTSRKQQEQQLVQQWRQQTDKHSWQVQWRVWRQEGLWCEPVWVVQGSCQASVGRGQMKHHSSISKQICIAVTPKFLSCCLDCVRGYAVRAPLLSSQLCCCLVQQWLIGYCIQQTLYCQPCRADVW